MYTKISRNAFQWKAFGAEQYLVTTHAAFEISECIEADQIIRVGTSRDPSRVSSVDRSFTAWWCGEWGCSGEGSLR